MGVGHHVLQAGIVDLPGKPVTVLQPAAVVLLAAGDELVPHPVDLLLGLAVDVERDRVVELEMGAAVEGDEVLASSLKAIAMTGTATTPPTHRRSSRRAR
jgi:hypothetical protein